MTVLKPWLHKIRDICQGSSRIKRETHWQTVSYLPVRGGSFSAPNETNNCSAARRASAEGGVGKGKLITCKNGKYAAIFMRRLFLSLVQKDFTQTPADRFYLFIFFWPYLCWGPSSVTPGPRQACGWSLPLRTNWSLQTPQTNTTCRNRDINISDYKENKKRDVYILYIS